MLNWLKGKFGKRNKITNITNLTISDDSFDLVTFVNKHKEVSGGDDEDLEAMRLSLLEDIGVSAPKKEMPKSESKFGILEDWAAKRKEASLSTLENSARQKAQVKFDSMLIEGFETLEIDDTGEPVISRIAVPDAVKSLFVNGEVPSERKIAELIQENPQHFRVLQKIKNAFGDKQNIPGSNYNEGKI